MTFTIEMCDRCGSEEADHHLETMTTSECLCSHCRRVSWSNILAHVENRTSAALTLTGKSEMIGLPTNR